MLCCKVKLVTSEWLLEYLTLTASPTKRQNLLFFYAKFGVKPSNLQFGPSDLNVMHVYFLKLYNDILNVIFITCDVVL